jgi:hypothetical protein
MLLLSSALKSKTSDFSETLLEDSVLMSLLPEVARAGYGDRGNAKFHNLYSSPNSISDRLNAS